VNSGFLGKINSLLVADYVEDNEFELLNNFEDAIDNGEIYNDDLKTIADKIYEYLINLKNIISDSDLNQDLTKLSVIS
jgi:hypothetical protein